MVLVVIPSTSAASVLLPWVRAKCSNIMRRSISSSVKDIIHAGILLVGGFSNSGRSSTSIWSPSLRRCSSTSLPLTNGGFLQMTDNSDEVLWQMGSNQGPITPTAQCLSDPVMACPYLHLRKRGGNLVLNWIDANGWNARKVHKIYPGLFPSDFN